MGSTQFLGEVRDLSVCNEADIALIPTGHFSFSEYSLPLTTTQMEDFSGDINPLNITTSMNAQGKASDLITSLQSPDWFLLMRVGVVVVPEPKQFSLNGADIAAPGSGSAVPEFTGFVPAAGIGGDATARPATLVWGHDSLQAAYCFLNAYRLEFLLNGKFQLFDELSAHIGACVSGENAEGFGQSLLGAAPYVRSVNDHARARAAGRTFIPQTVTAGTPNTPAQPPIVPVSYGGLNMAGIFGGWYPTNGVLLYPGMPIQARFVQQSGDPYYYPRLLRHLRDEGAVQYDVNFTGVVTGIGFAQSVMWKGGLFKVGLLLSGYSIAPYACVQAYKHMGSMLGFETREKLYAAVSNALMSRSREAGFTLNGLGDIDSLDLRPMALPAARLAPALRHARPGWRPGVSSTS